MKRGPAGPDARGFTLVEMLLVVFILAAVAATAVSVLDTADEQLRYDDTSRRLSALRAGALGDETPAGRSAPSGFVADVGRLPSTVDELLVKPTALPAWDAATEAGWRGPYVVLPPQQAGQPPAFPDGWGAGAGAPDHGWTVTLAPAGPVTPATVVTIASAGQADIVGPETSMQSEDGFVQVLPLTLRVTFDVADIQAHLASLIPALELRARLHFPAEGVDTTWDSTDGGALVPLPSLPGHSALEFSFPARELPWGVRRIEIVLSDGAPFGSGTDGRVLLLPRTTPPRFDMSWSVL